MADFVEVKGWKAMGNKLGNYLRMSGFTWIINDSSSEADDNNDRKTADELTLFT